MSRRKNPAVDQTDNPLRKIKASRIIWPILIGLGVVGYMFYKEFNPEALKFVHWGWRAALFLPIAVLLMAGRDLGYIWRIMILAEGSLTFLQSLRIVLLWEFTSAITPSAIGGTSVAILYVNKEGLSVGRSSAVVMATSFLDELYFIIAFPILLFVVKSTVLFSIEGSTDGWAGGLMTMAIIAYCIKVAYTLVLAYGFFINPRGLKWLILKIFKLSILRKWRQGANQAGTDIIASSKDFKSKPFWYWLKAFFATFVSWTSRYWVANAIILAFFVVHDQFLIFARQLVMWIMMLISPTPGGSGFAEFVFTRYLGPFIPVDAAYLGSVIVVLALMWRLITYYPYLIIGVFMLPRWISRHFMGGKKREGVNVEDMASKSLAQDESLAERPTS